MERNFLEHNLQLHNWNIKDGDYIRDSDYDQLYIAKKTIKDKIARLFWAGLAMAVIITFNWALL